MRQAAKIGIRAPVTELVRGKSECTVILLRIQTPAE